MWFLTKVSQSKLFYNSSGQATEVSDVDWTYSTKHGNQIITSSHPVIANPMQAIAALYEANIPGFQTKALAKEFGKTLPQGSWKYLKIKYDISYLKTGPWTGI
ncbi:hypothetical protein [Pseudoalteromonas sp. T1lg122]|uniref:hypothetical protein n=1 Tax=Pseudoalteromonas sp. T1lg122 TaxID=2077094 RepID=UPI000CF697B0|nr:hypothetical protein [Pseudoalteromonas sp. T1lg122]